MIIKELNFPIVCIKDKAEEYGGNQDWFPQEWQRRAGCGSTSGANLAVYYASNKPQMTKLYDGDVLKFSQSDYLQAMEVMYTYMKPGPMGYPYLKKFAKQFVLFCKDRGVLIEANIFEKFNATEEAFGFVKKNIDDGNPIALLILFHQAQELKEDNWHWVTITGYVEDEQDPKTSQIILSNCGQRQIVNTHILFEVHKKNIVRMVSFKDEIQ